jgi:two-component system OmpR family response regulator/two-component system alkaline phosphatase synthesis response regulator PhoP
MPHALIVEDDAHIRDLIVLHLGLEGLETTAIGDGREALDRLGATPYDLVVLDLMLPGVDGIAVCRALRRGGPNHDVPVLMLTARREESDKVLGLESGADDYLAKPFGVRELVARARALLRRPRASQIAAAASTAAASADVPTGERPVHVHGIDIDPARRRVRVRGEEVELTAQEFRLLYLLASHPGIVFSREALLSRVWPDHTFVTLRSVDTLVKRLRRRIEITPGEPSLILTIWGSGYKFADV